MAAIEKVLYGDATTDPRLPLPDEIAQIITEAQAAQYSVCNNEFLQPPACQIRCVGDFFIKEETIC